MNMRKQRFFYCPKCGGKLQHQQVAEKQRLVCLSCGYIFYENPIVGVAAIVMENGKILLGRRSATASYPGLWCIPCGYVEYEEDVYDAVCREFYEETGLRIKVEQVFTALSNFHNPNVHTVGIWFIAHAIGGTLQAGDDIAEVGFFALDSVPELAFPTDMQVIELLKNKSKGFI